MSTLTSFSASDFQTFLASPQVFTLDLSQSSLLEIIDKYCQVKAMISPRIGKSHKCLIKQLRDIQERFGCVLKPEQITDVFWNYFVAYAINEGHLALSSIKTLCAQLRSVLSWAARHNARVSPSYDFIRLPKYNHEQIALTPDEVSHIFHFDISTIDRRKQYLRNMERVRDHFVLSCNLGQRFSDMVRIDKSCFDRNIFSIMQQKTGVKCRLDIDRLSMDANTTYKILEKYGFTAPIQGDISAYDRYIKQLLQYIGGEFLEKVKREEKINGVVETTFEPKYKLISSHTPRRTFVTVNILRGYTEAEVRRASGHKSMSSFEKYLCYYE